MIEPGASQIGPYTIQREIGRGGMGVVYLARDTRLDRDVAIKCLPDELAGDPVRFTRFEREAKSLASLNHPNIASIYGFEEFDGKHYLILEYVPGETLDEVLASGPMPVSEALRAAKQIAEAVEAAHEKGIIHRDLKPANIKFAQGEVIKVLDFGLAKAFDENQSMSRDLATSPTYIPTHTPTMPGMVLGTAGYLSPEQARARPVDKRSDIFSFGCVLFEMLSGERIFPGETATDSLGATLHKEPNWNALPAGTPPTITLLLRRCLSKDRKRRLHDIADARVEIEDAITDPTGSSLNLASSAIAAAGGNGPRSKVGMVAAFLIGAILTAGGAFVLTQTLRTEPSPPPVEHLSIVVPQSLESFGPLLAASPDGSILAFRGTVEDEQRSTIFLRPLDQPLAKELPSALWSSAMAFSPDGKWLALSAERGIQRVSVTGGPATTLCARLTNSATALTWARDQYIYFTEWNDRGIYRVNENGGEKERVVELDDTFPRSSIQVLPNGSIVFDVAKEMFGGPYSIQVHSASDGTVKTLIENASNPVLTPTGHILFYREGTIMAAPFDAQRLELDGSAVSLVEGVAEVRFWGGAQFALAEDGTAFHLSKSPDSFGQSELLSLDSEGTATALTTWSQDFDDARVSPDGRRIVVGVVEDTSNTLKARIWMLDLERDIPTLLIADDGTYFDPRWSPDGQWVYCVSWDLGSSSNRRLYKVQADGGGSPQLVVELPDGSNALGDVSPDGSLITFNAFNRPDSGADGNSDIMVVHVSEDPPRIEPWLATTATEYWARFSPNGRWVCYSSNETGNTEIYVRPLHGQGKWRISRDGGSAPFWSPDGTQLFFVTRRGEQRMLMRADITSGHEPDPQGATTFMASVPIELFVLPKDLDSPELQLFPDGKRFLAVAPKEKEKSDALTEIHVTKNLFEELKRRSPVKP